MICTFSNPNPAHTFSLSLSLLADSNRDGFLQRAEIVQFFDKLSREEQHKMIRAYLDFTGVERDKIVRRVFDALDVNGDGQVSRDEVLFWLVHEKAWRQYGGHLRRQRINRRRARKHRRPIPPGRDDLDKRGLSHYDRDKIYHQIDTNHDDKITFEELRDFFESWTLREIRTFTEDQMYYVELRDFAKKPTAEKRAVLKRTMSNRQFDNQLDEDDDKKHGIRSKAADPDSHPLEDVEDSVALGDDDGAHSDEIVIGQIAEELPSDQDDDIKRPDDGADADAEDEDGNAIGKGKQKRKKGRKVHRKRTPRSKPISKRLKAKEAQSVGKVLAINGRSLSFDGMHVAANDDSPDDDRES
jgi:Ca2+-binding EF-hand superfamily protein